MRGHAAAEIKRFRDNRVRTKKGEKPAVYSDCTDRWVVSRTRN